jgi:uncharacterized RDD family membrane protein YckC
MAAFFYEGVLLFAVLMISAYLYSALTQMRHALNGLLGLQLFLFLILGIYFAWFWSHGGQTVAMKAWHIRLVDRFGNSVGQGRAVVRYLLSWLWFVPALISMRWLEHPSGATIAALLFVGVFTFAGLSRLHPKRQFWHDAVCGTQLVTWRPLDNAKSKT